MEWIAPLITAIKSAGPPIYAAVLVATLLLLFLPDPFIAQLGLADFRQLYRTYAGIALIASASLLSVHVISRIAAFAMVKWEARRLHRDGLTTLAELTNEEKEFLRPFILKGENTRYASISDGVVKGLELKRLVYRAANVSVPGGHFHFPYNMQPYIRRILQERPQLLD